MKLFHEILYILCDRAICILYLSVLSVRLCSSNNTNNLRIETWINKSIFRAHDISPDFHKYVDDSHNREVNHIPVSFYKRQLFIFILKNEICNIYDKRKKRFARDAGKTAQDVSLKSLLNNSRMGTILFRERPCHASGASLMVIIIIFRTLQSHASQEGNISGILKGYLHV